MSEADLRALADDIEAHGLRSRITAWRGDDGVVYIIDGRNRLNALQLLGRPVEDHVSFVRCKAAAIPALVVSMNVVRRHLDIRQRVELALQAVTAARAFEVQHVRVPGGHKRVGVVSRIAEAAGLSKPTVYSHLREIAPDAVPTQAEIAARIASALENIDKLPPVPERRNGHTGGRPPSLARRIAKYVGVSAGTVSRHLAQQPKNGNGNGNGKADRGNVDDLTLLRAARELERVCGADLSETGACYLKRCETALRRLGVEFDSGQAVLAGDVAPFPIAHHTGA